MYSVSVLKRVVQLVLALLVITESLAQVPRGQLREEILESMDAEQQTTGWRRNRQPVTPIEAPPPITPIRSPYDQQNARIIVMENADLLRFDQLLRPDVQIATGNVLFRHDDATLTCDSAYFYQANNSMDAFSNVVINQGDTLFAYGDRLYYDGNTRLARLRGNVRLVNRQTTLTTDSLNYDRITELAYYFTGGKIVDAENTLTSVWGQYSTNSDDALFRDSVRLLNESFTMTSDTLMYYTRTNIADMEGRTHIIHQNDTEIFTDKGWYDTATERSMLLNRSTVLTGEGKSLVADTIFYDKKSGYGESFGNVVLNDTVQKSTLHGNYLYYSEEQEFGQATDSALLIDWSDSLRPLYLHADTLQTFQDDSLFNHAKAWYNVRFYREDLQGLSDSLYYNGVDSVMTLFYDPILWQDNQQMSADQVSIFTVDQGVNKVVLSERALAVEMVDTVHFNQITGKEIVAFMDSSQISRVEVNGNAETIYYAREEGSVALLGANRTESSKVVMHFENKKIDRIVLTAASSGVFYPQHLVIESNTRLENFFWAEKLRPMSKGEVFLRFPADERSALSFRTLGTPSIVNDFVREEEVEGEFSDEQPDNLEQEIELEKEIEQITP